jgi:hypothetical protein
LSKIEKVLLPDLISFSRKVEAKAPREDTPIKSLQLEAAAISFPSPLPPARKSLASLALPKDHRLRKDRSMRVPTEARESLVLKNLLEVGPKSLENLALPKERVPRDRLPARKVVAPSLTKVMIDLRAPMTHFLLMEITEVENRDPRKATAKLDPKSRLPQAAAEIAARTRTRTEKARVEAESPGRPRKRLMEAKEKERAERAENPRNLPRA